MTTVDELKKDVWAAAEQHFGLAPHAAMRAATWANVCALASSQSERPAEWLAALITEPASGQRWRLALPALVNHETYFMRGMPQLRELRETVLPALGAAAAAENRAVRIWCAGVSTGEEAYSVAYLAHELGVRAQVLGTDIEEGALTRARAAVYGHHAVMGLTPTVRDAMLTEVASDTWEIRPEIAAGVTFQLHNLVSTLPPESTPFDLILCRNVLIYFRQPLAMLVAGRLAEALVPGGVLILGESEGFLEPVGPALPLDDEHPNFYRRPLALVTSPAAPASAQSAREAAVPSGQQHVGAASPLLTARARLEDAIARTAATADDRLATGRGTASVSDLEVAPGVSGPQVLLLKIAGEQYAIDVANLSEVILRAPLTALPGVPDFVLGARAVHGEVLTVLNLQVLLGLPEAPDNTPDGHLLVVELDGARIALAVDAIEGFARLPDWPHRAPAAAAQDGTDRFVMALTPDVARVLDVAALFTDPTLRVSRQSLA